MIATTIYEGGLAVLYLKFFFKPLFLTTIITVHEHFYGLEISKFLSVRNHHDVGALALQRIRKFFKTFVFATTIMRVANTSMPYNSLRFLSAQDHQ